MDQPTGDPQIIFDAIVADMEIRQRVREFDTVDHSGTNTPTAEQIQQARAIMDKAKELRRILRS